MRVGIIPYNSHIPPPQSPPMASGTLSPLLFPILFPLLLLQLRFTSQAPPPGVGTTRPHETQSGGRVTPAHRRYLVLDRHGPRNQRIPIARSTPCERASTGGGAIDWWVERISGRNLELNLELSPILELFFPGTIHVADIGAAALEELTRRLDGVTLLAYFHRTSKELPATIIAVLTIRFNPTGMGEAGRQRAHFQDLFVDENHRNREVGSCLAQVAFSHLADIANAEGESGTTAGAHTRLKGICFRVADDNCPALYLYLKAGCRVVGRRRDNNELGEVEEFDEAKRESEQKRLEAVVRRCREAYQEEAAAEEVEKLPNCLVNTAVTLHRAVDWIAAGLQSTIRRCSTRARDKSSSRKRSAVVKVIMVKDILDERRREEDGRR